MTTHDADAAHLVELYDTSRRIANVAARRTQEGTLRAVDVDAVLEAGRALDVACEAFRARYYPRRANVCVGLRQVFTRSASGRSLRLVFDPERVEVAR